MAWSSTTGGNPLQQCSSLHIMARSALYVDEVDDGVGQNIDDLLDGLDGTARTERAELIEWLLEQGITADEIRATSPPLLLASRHLIGDDGTLRIGPGDQ